MLFMKVQKVVGSARKRCLLVYEGRVAVIDSPRRMAMANRRTPSIPTGVNLLRRLMQTMRSPSLRLSPPPPPPPPVTAMGSGRPTKRWTLFRPMPEMPARNDYVISMCTLQAKFSSALEAELIRSCCIACLATCYPFRRGDGAPAGPGLRREQVFKLELLTRSPLATCSESCPHWDATTADAVFAG